MADPWDVHATLDLQEDGLGDVGDVKTCHQILPGHL